MDTLSFSISDGTITLDEKNNNKKRGGRNKGKSLLDFPSEYIMLDIETTGLSPLRDEATISQYSSLVQPSNYYYWDEDCEEDYIIINGEKAFYIDSFITKLTGITNKMLEQAPPLASVLNEFQNFIGNSTLVGHNANFDINFLYDAFLECLGTELKNNYIDTLRLARRLLPDLPHHRLDDLTKYYQISSRNLHRSLNDCDKTISIYASLKKEVIS
ncbi:MAG: 3'-5' exonuclease [Anaerovoracaceae bacterium]